MKIRLDFYGSDTGNCRDIFRYEVKKTAGYVCRVPAGSPGKVKYFSIPGVDGEPLGPVDNGIIFVYGDKEETTRADPWTGDGTAEKRFNFTWEVKK